MKKHNKYINWWSVNVYDVADGFRPIPRMYSSKKEAAEDAGEEVKRWLKRLQGYGQSQIVVDIMIGTVEEDVFK